MVGSSLVLHVVVSWICRKYLQTLKFKKVQEGFTPKREEVITEVGFPKF